MLLMIDNYDSFTYNLVQYFFELGQEVEVRRNDEISIDQIIDLNPEYLVISPGPCTPNEAGISLEAVKYFKGKIPILGVCLGHQCIGQAFGSKIIRAKKLMHGKLSKVINKDNDLQVVIRGDGEVKYEKIVLLMGVLQQLGSKNIGLITRSPSNK